jgi:hypothetical protein
MRISAEESAMGIAFNSRCVARVASLVLLASAAAGKVSAQAAAAEPVPVPVAAATEPTPSPKDYRLPALEIIGFDFLLNRVNRNYGSSRDDYDVSLRSIRRNLRSSWGVDSDPFRTNQLGHPYQGSMYHGFARSAGLDYWESAGYAFAGSAMWEIAGEKTPPSRNDQISSGVGGTFLGEALYRMSSLLLEKGGGLSPAWREAAAAVISPSNGFNRLAMGRRLDTIFASRSPAYYSQVQVGVMGTTQNVQGTSTVLKRNEARADFSLDYGMPGKDGYRYSRPFDYFSFQATVSSADIFENVSTRGLLLGRDYEAGRDYRGIWGLYGSYDYISPQTFRISSTALSLGTTGQWRASDTVAVQGTAMGGVGYAAVGTINGTAERDYHYGVAPQALLALRVIFGDRSSLDITGREYFVSRVAGTGRGGHDNIARADIAYTWRIRDQHAVTVKYLWNRRDATFGDLAGRSQTRGTVGIFYTLLGHEHFGRVDWR